MRRGSSGGGVSTSLDHEVDVILPAEAYYLRHLWCAGYTYNSTLCLVRTVIIEVRREWSQFTYSFFFARVTPSANTRRIIIGADTDNLRSGSFQLPPQFQRTGK